MPHKHIRVMRKYHAMTPISMFSELIIIEFLFQYTY